MRVFLKNLALKALVPILILGSETWLCWDANAMVQVGAGMSSFTASRSIPAAYLGLEFTNFLVTGSSTGYATRYDYLSGYTLNLYKVWGLGDFLWIDTRGGFGLGGYFSRRGYRDTFDQTANSKDDFGIGPCFEIAIYPLNFFFIRIESTFGVGHLANIFLAFKEMTVVSGGMDW